MTTLDLLSLDASTLARQLVSRQLTAVDLAQACLQRIAELDPQLHAFAHTDPAATLAAARRLDDGALTGPLHGLPLGVKDLMDTADMPTTYGSALYAGHQPRADAAAVALCREAGALVIGKTVSTEFAYFTPGPTANPANLAHTPGGSSSGSAAAVAAGLVPLALGTQTAGSIIRPAAFCGVVGYKPSQGRVPRAGVKSLSDTLDVVGGFGRSVADVALLGRVLTGDSRLLDALDAPLATLPRIGLCTTPHWDQADADTQATWQQAVRTLAALAPGQPALVDAPLPTGMPDLVALQKAVMAFEMSRALSHERLQHRHRLSDRLLALLDDGQAISGADHAAHLAQTQAAQQQVNALFDQVDLLLAPSTIGEAPAGLAATGDPLFCRGWTLLGLPCIHLPLTVGRRRLPMGLQLVGRWGDDHRLLAAAHRLHPLLDRRQPAAHTA